MNREDVPSWILDLDKESLEFIRKFVINSGSLKKVASHYQVSYPTVRTKLDKLVQKIELSSNKKDEEFVQMVKSMVIDERISLDVAKEIIESYKKERGNEE